MIKFGSRTELVLPASFVAKVAVGSRVKGGETAVALLPND
jgi:phosphatidylserine decarboxylase